MRTNGRKKSIHSFNGIFREVRVEKCIEITFDGRIHTSAQKNLAKRIL